MACSWASSQSTIRPDGELSYHRHPNFACLCCLVPRTNAWKSNQTCVESWYVIIEFLSRFCGGCWNYGTILASFWILFGSSTKALQTFLHPLPIHRSWAILCKELAYCYVIVSRSCYLSRRVTLRRSKETLKGALSPTSSVSRQLIESTCQAGPNSAALSQAVCHLTVDSAL